MLELTTKTAASGTKQSINRVPLSTYRLQLGADLTLDQVYALLPYLEKLGITDIYLSPLFRARAESSHGYDVVDHGTIDPAIGDITSFERLATAAGKRGMGLLLDVVPNHMGINDPGNAWWLDVLENGEGSYFADFFDIEWHPPAGALQDKVLLPYMGEPFGKVLENAELQVVYADQRLQLSYGSRRLPLTPPSWPMVLEIAIAQHAQTIGSDQSRSADWDELDSIVTELRNLPPGSHSGAQAMDERYREQKIASRRLDQLLTSSPIVRAALDGALQQINGRPGDPKSFDQLEKLLDQQWYRLAYWRVAADEINYRRFFDINDLAAIRVEDPRVFEAVHRLVARLLERGWVTGLRIDHPDGLRDPQKYFKNLQSLFRSSQPANGSGTPAIYVVAEKILSGDEPLSADWAVSGTTGYELLNIINRLLVSAEGFTKLRTNYVRITNTTAKPADIVYEARRTVLLTSMASELQMLTAQLYRIARQHRASRDFTQPALQQALREVLASMTVYRTYARDDCWDISDDDYRTVTSAVRMAKRRNRTMATSVFDFIASVLLLEHPPTLTTEQADERRRFALKFQQVSGPVAAKGVEDTAFYRYYPLASLNEVGGELDAKPLAADEFHRLMRHRNESWPHSLSATSTHDSKRGEDFRARLHVLSELPQEWAATFDRWHAMNRPLVRERDEDSIPDANEEYLIYQTLVGTWPLKPLSPPERDEYRDRILAYFEKALREAKVHTSWMNPSETYDSAVREFITALLDPEHQSFANEVAEFVAKIADAGFVNSLAQLLLKLTLPGVPDFYRGTELWDFNLVDPDNRRPVDYDARHKRLQKLWKAADRNLPEFARNLSAQWPNADLKLWITSSCLQLRRRLPDLFTAGEYIPLETTGAASEHVIAFARRLDQQVLVTVVPRHIYDLCTSSSKQNNQTGPPPVDWMNTTLTLPDDLPTDWCCALSGREYNTNRLVGPSTLSLAELFEVFPVALLTSELK